MSIKSKEDILHKVFVEYPSEKEFFDYLAGCRRFTIPEFRLFFASGCSTVDKMVEILQKLRSEGYPLIRKYFIKDIEQNWCIIEHLSDLSDEEQDNICELTTIWQFD